MTLIRADTGARGISTLPQDLLQQVRGRLRLLALLVAIGFAIDAVGYLASWLQAVWTDRPLPADFAKLAWIHWLNVGAAVGSLGFSWASGSRAVSTERLHTLGLVYEVAICFVVAIVSYESDWIATHNVPVLTWVPALVIIFPLIMPGPPRRMLIAAGAAAAMGPLGLLTLDVTGMVPATGSQYFSVSVNSTFAVAFAYMSARAIYGLGRQVAAARELGAYRLEAQLAKGGMGEVWRARHRLLARPAAIKIIRSSIAGGASPDAQRRFELEAQVIASLRSPHTIDLFDFGVSADGNFYYVMELLDGLDLDRLVRDHGPLPAERVIFVLSQVCHSLSEAESRGLVHRDIKPGNILLCRYGEDLDFVKVLDFGLVKALGDETDAAQRRTADNVVAGTPAFIAPEQALGRKNIDGRADIYATGCVAYWLLTGQLVFSGDSAVDVMLHHANTAPTPPSSRTEIPIPAALEQVVLSCLAKDPADRPQTARELQRRLAEVDGTKSWTTDRAQQWWQTHRPARPA